MSREGECIISQHRKLRLIDILCREIFTVISERASVINARRGDVVRNNGAGACVFERAKIQTSES
jgi:hypothetical protein